MSLAESLAATILVSLTAYALLAGADFGGGVWDLVASGPRKEQQRRLVAQAIAPVWEANHVWLILAIVMLFTCFPAAFARLAIALHVPLTLMLIGIVLRGSTFMFQSYGGGGRRVVAYASLVTPVLLGVAVGAIASGATSVPAGVTFVEGYVRPWLTAFALAIGLFALACFAFLAAVYLTVEARDRELQEDFRRRALVAGIIVAANAGVGLLLSPQAPLVERQLLREEVGVPQDQVSRAAVFGHVGQIVDVKGFTRPREAVELAVRDGLEDFGLGDAVKGVHWWVREGWARAPPRESSATSG